MTNTVLKDSMKLKINYREIERGRADLKWANVLFWKKFGEKEIFLLNYSCMLKLWVTLNDWI